MGLALVICRYNERCRNRWVYERPGEPTVDCEPQCRKEEEREDELIEEYQKITLCPEEEEKEKQRKKRKLFKSATIAAISGHR